VGIGARRPAGPSQPHTATADGSTGLFSGETLANTVFATAQGALQAWLTFDGNRAAPLIDTPPRGLFGLLPGAFLFSFLVTVCLTLATRRRARRGTLRAVCSRPWVPLPRNLWLRAATLATGSLLAMGLVPYFVLAMGVRQGMWAPVLSRNTMLVVFAMYFGVLSLIVTPLVIARAHQDICGAET
jgi:hypothetical protein